MGEETKGLTSQPRKKIRMKMSRNARKEGNWGREKHREGEEKAKLTKHWKLKGHNIPLFMFFS